MPYNLSIPGQVSEHQLKAIESVATLVPKNGKVVEVGSLFGCSSWAWAKSVDSSVTVYCIDPWEKNEGVRAMEARLGIKYGIEQFKAHTADCPNIRALRGYSPVDFQNWSDPVDLYYEDAVHTNPTLERNLDFWSGRIKPSGILCGDDYRPRFPDVMSGAQKLAARFGRTLICVDFFWCLLPDNSVLPGAAAVADRLRELSAEHGALKRKRGTMLYIGPRKPLEMVATGTNPVVPCRVSNESLDVWPKAQNGRVTAGVRITTEAAPDVVIVETRMALPTEQLAPDLSVDFDVVLPLSPLTEGSYRLIFDLVNPDGTWAVHREVALATASVLTIGPAGSSMRSQRRLVAFDTATETNADSQTVQTRIATVPCEIARAGAGETVPIDSTYRLGDRISFANGGDSARYTRAGWVGQEARHRWMQSIESHLVFNVVIKDAQAASINTIRLRGQLRPLVGSSRHKSQSLTITVNGHAIHTGEYSKPFRLDVAFSMSVLMAKRPSRIGFFHPNAVRPIDLSEWSSDLKPLAFAVEWLSLEPSLE